MTNRQESDPGTSPTEAQDLTPTQAALVIDAMGEVREEYTDELCQEIVDSGLNAIAITLCDPKSYEQQAYDLAMEAEAMLRAGVRG